MITVKKISDEKDLASAHQIRKTVFVEEQHCPEELEWEYDEESVHFLGCFNNLPCAAARWRQTSKMIFNRVPGCFIFYA